MTKKTEPQTSQDPNDPDYLRPPSWHDKHGRPEIRVPRSLVRGEVEPRITPPKDQGGQKRG